MQCKTTNFKNTTDRRITCHEWSPQKKPEAKSSPTELVLTTLCQLKMVPECRTTHLRIKEENVSIQKTLTKSKRRKILRNREVAFFLENPRTSSRRRLDKADTKGKAGERAHIRVESTKERAFESKDPTPPFHLPSISLQSGKSLIVSLVWVHDLRASKHTGFVWFDLFFFLFDLRFIIVFLTIYAFGFAFVFPHVSIFPLFLCDHLFLLEERLRLLWLWQFVCL